ncbi:hypothetical protein C1645_829800 [Glomus cerebriforme]|uniref:Uncharacterized protein n=1 Tax=Glomus cerebriforme TaxID=658196 RepID=A0A397SJ81_9GLOM|nr:hypothetical protein C1645_829800 [Glomus cerebriforme]
MYRRGRGFGFKVLVAAEMEIIMQEQAFKNASEVKEVIMPASSELSYKGSDYIVYITNGRYITTVWKKILKRETSVRMMLIFISSALVTTDSQTRVEELVKELGNPESGLKRLKEIIKFPFISYDAGLKNGYYPFNMLYYLS